MKCSSLINDSLKVTCDCNNKQQFLNQLYRIANLLPALLDLDLYDSIYVRHVEGKVGDVDFTYEIPDTLFILPRATPESTSAKIKEAFDNFAAMQGIRSVRLQAALEYHHAARRLLQAGYTKWEFMGEAVLNLAKALEMLFPGDSFKSADAIRNGLRQLGYTGEQIESNFIPVIFLRNHWDVAHGRLSIPSQDELCVLYNYLEIADDAIRYMLKIVIRKSLQGNYGIAADGDLTLDADDVKAWDRMKQSVAQRLPNTPLGNPLCGNQP